MLEPLVEDPPHARHPTHQHVVGGRVTAAKDLGGEVKRVDDPHAPVRSELAEGALERLRRALVPRARGGMEDEDARLGVGRRCRRGRRAKKLFGV